MTTERKTRADLIEEVLRELADGVFGREVGDCPNIYGDYDALSVLSGRVRLALSNKPHHGRVLVTNFYNTLLGQHVNGRLLDHPNIRGKGHTSHVRVIGPVVGEGLQATREIETDNSRYTLVLEGEESRRPGWPWKGDKMRYLGQNGYDHERARAAECGFVPGALYTVVDIEVHDFSHSISFGEIGGRWNGVMFESVPQV